MHVRLHNIHLSSVVHETSSNQAATELVDLQTWMSSTPPTSPKLNKKKKKGYHHLSSGSEDEEANSVIGEKQECCLDRLVNFNLLKRFVYPCFHY